MNESNTDRIIRAVLGIAALLIAFLVTGGILQIILWILGGILLFTAATGHCLLYIPFHFSTRK
ncbi:DUF2892 domain-containing protein [Chloroflexota bacterium]